MPLPNFMHIMFCSNSSQPLPLSNDARRFFVLQVSAQRRNQHAYFQEIIDELDQGGLEILLADLLDEPLNGFNPRTIPQTHMKLDVKMEGMNSAERYIIDVLREGRLNPLSALPAEPYLTEMAKTAVYNQYCFWCDYSGNEYRKVNMETFSKSLKGLIPSLELNRRRHNVRFYALPDLESARQECCESLDASYEQLFGDQNDESE